jgi:hypothetical protein
MQFSLSSIFSLTCWIGLFLGAYRNLPHPVAVIFLWLLASFGILVLFGSIGMALEYYCDPMMREHLKRHYKESSGMFDMLDNWLKH